MNRLGLLLPSELTPAQHESYNVIREYTDAHYGTTFMHTNSFTTMDNESRLLGPFGIHVHYPEVAKAFVAYANGLRTLDLPSEVKECAILGVGSRLGAAYEQYAHEKLSGFSEQEIETLHNGSCPDHFSNAQKTAYKIALALGKAGPLPQAEWDEAVYVLGREGAAALIFYVAFYAYVSTVLNGFDAKVPE